MIDFLKLFKEATFLISAGSLFQSAGAAATKERAPSVGSIFCVGGSSRVLLFERTISRFRFDSYKFTDVGRRETVNSLESEKQDLELNSLYDR